jgi:hypothetical protein
MTLSPGAGTSTLIAESRKFAADTERRVRRRRLRSHMDAMLITPILLQPTRRRLRHISQAIVTAVSSKAQGKDDCCTFWHGQDCTHFIFPWLSASGRFWQTRRRVWLRDRYCIRPCIQIRLIVLDAVSFEARQCPEASEDHTAFGMMGRSDWEKR